MINLAGIRYRNVFADRQGPIVRLDTSDCMIEGMRLFQANAFLRPEYFPARPKRSVYSEACGSGTHESPMVARLMAISEAMERWAYHAKARATDRAAYGFDVDPMSNGMAAFPGLWARQARRKAYLEAVERFCIIAWWEGMLPSTVLPTEWEGITATVIWQARNEIVVILHKKTADGLHAYGHAGAETFQRACRSAVVELARHESVIRTYHLAKACAVIGAPSDLLEQRSVFFASEEGHEEFVRRLRSVPTRTLPARRLAFDGVIPGPWQKYADVWRVVFHPVTDRYLSRNAGYFLW
jgi:hypothetical protein